MKRNTIQRQLVMDGVLDLKNHPTAEEVYYKIVERYPDISMGTVYRNLNGLVEDGRIKKISVPEAADRFDHLTSPHYHMKCIKCGCIFDLNVQYMSEIDKEAAESSGFDIQSHETMFKGECLICGSQVN